MHVAIGSTSHRRRVGRSFWPRLSASIAVKADRTGSAELTLCAV